jgi:threonine aldolase
MIPRLAEDHANARRLALGLARIPGISIEPDALPTNLVFLTVEADNHRELVPKLDERGVKVVPRDGGLWRLVTHADITTDDIDYALEVIEAVFREHARA